MNAMGSIPTEAMTALLPSKRLEKLRIMRPLMKEILGRQSYALAGFVVLCVWYTVDPGRILQMLLISSGAAVMGRCTYSLHAIETLIPVRRLHHIRCIWFGSIAAPIAAMVLILGFALLFGRHECLRDFVVTLGVSAVLLGQEFATVLPPRSTTRAGHPTGLFGYAADLFGNFLVCFFWLAFIEGCASEPDSRFFLGLGISYAFWSIIRSYVACGRALQNKYRPGIMRWARTRSATVPRFVPRWRAALYPLEGAAWVAAQFMVVMSFLIVLFASDKDQHPTESWDAMQLVLGIVSMLLLIMLGGVCGQASRFVRTLPISHTRRLLFFWSLPTIIGLAICVLVALEVMAWGRSEPVCWGIMACSVFPWCWIWFAFGVRARPGQHNWTDLFLRPVPPILAVAVPFVFIYGMVAVVFPAEATLLLSGVSGTVVALIAMAVFLLLCEAATDLRGVRRWMPWGRADETEPELSVTFSNPSLLMKGLIVACLVALIGLIVFGPQHSAPSSSQTPLAAPATEKPK